MARIRLVRKGRVVAKTADRREEIVRGASAVLRQRRSGTLRMDEVAEQLGLVKGNIYYYFKDRQDLIFHCHQRCIEMSLDVLQETSKRGGSVEARLRELLRRHIEVIVGSPYGGALLADIDELTPAQRQRNVAMRDRFEAGVRKLIAEGVARGEFPKTNVALAGFGVLGSINWIPKWFRENGSLNAQAIAAWFADFLVGALKR